MTQKETLVADVELYRNYFLIGFRNVATGNVRQFEMYDGQPLAIDSIRNILARYRVITFNGINYDVPIITKALQGATCDELKDISDKIIVNNIKYWNLGIEPLRFDHIDIFDVAPGMASLKIYGGRLHCRKMQDLPITPDALITPEQRELLKTYNANDLVTTQQLWEHLQPQIELREKMSAVYDIDLRSKSDAQIAEAVIVKEVGRALGSSVQRPEVASGTRFGYTPPKFLRFETPELKELLDLICRVQFLVPDGGAVQLPPELAKRTVRVGAGVYRLGIGGLHSSEQGVSHYSDDEYVLLDRDVASYYPEIILRTGLAPAHMGSAFTRCYQDLVDQRLKAKRAGNKVAADSLKITVNGSFGKLGSKWSKLYSPSLMIQTTITGQLSLLMLIETLESAGIEVVSANTDGVAIKCRRGRLAELGIVISDWEKRTGFTTEETEYRALHSRDVNNYLAIKIDGKFKLKGAFAMEELCASPTLGLMKNPANEVCIEAMALFLRNSVPIEQTIADCTDIRKFITIRQVNGGAVDQQGGYLGKAVRWYYAKGVEGPLRYKLNGYTVARSEGAKPCMELPEQLPADLDYAWYVKETMSLLADVGVDPVTHAVRDLV